MMTRRAGTMSRILAISSVLLAPIGPIRVERVGAQERTVEATGAERPPGIAGSRAELLALTPLWKGERSADGRPRVSDDLLRRMKNVSIEEAWDVLRRRGYESQFVAGWQMVHADRPFVGRALTAAYLPGRPDLVERGMPVGKPEGRIGPANSWPNDMRPKADVCIA